MKTSPVAVSDLASNQSKPQQPGDAGFSLVELLTTIAIILLLALFLSPALARTQANDRAFVCLNNIRQLVSAWRMYAEDNGGHVVPNTSGSGSGHEIGGPQGWVGGWLSWVPGDTDNTNVFFLTNGKLGPYTRSVSIYKCPADIYNCRMGPLTLPRVRSVSMNSFIGVADFLGRPDPSYGTKQTPPCYTYQKMSEMVHPSPSDLWVFVDEHPDSINDGYLFETWPGGGDWGDLPASYHAGACSIGFADGHAVIHKWRDPGTLQPVRQQNSRSWNSYAPNDTLWFMERTTAPIQ